MAIAAKKQAGKMNLTWEHLWRRGCGQVNFWGTGMPSPDEKIPSRLKTRWIVSNSWTRANRTDRSKFLKMKKLPTWCWRRISNYRPWNKRPAFCICRKLLMEPRLY
jgi:hypothetical protein